MVTRSLCHTHASHSKSQRLTRMGGRKQVQKTTTTVGLAKPADKVWCRTKLDHQKNTVPVAQGACLAIRTTLLVTVRCGRRTTSPISPFSVREHANNEDVRQKFLRAVAIKQGDEATDFLRGDVYREVNRI